MIDLLPWFDAFTLWLAITSITLLVTSETLSPHYGRIQFLLNKRRVKNVAYALSIMFLAIIVIRVFLSLSL